MGVGLEEGSACKRHECERGHERKVELADTARDAQAVEVGGFHDLYVSSPVPEAIPNEINDLCEYGCARLSAKTDSLR